MFKFAPGSTSVSLYFRLRDSTTGLAKTGLTASSGGAVASYTRQRGSATSISISALSGPTASWSAGGFIQVDATLAPGLYRLDIPDAACASGVPFVVASLAFTGVIQESCLVRLETATNNIGAGAIPWTITVTSGGNPLEDAEVWVSTDAAGSNVIAGVINTNALGQAAFMLDAGSYFLWVVHVGYTGTNPTAFAVS